VGQLLKNSETATNQNNCIDLYQDYFVAKDESQQVIPETTFNSEPPSCRTVAVFRDPNEIKRTATSISWHPDTPNKMAISYSILQFQQMPERMPIKSYIWDIEKPNQPDAELAAQSPLVCLEYNPRNADNLVGGSYNGQVAFWDLRKSSQPLDSSVLEKSHYDPVYKVFWIQSRTGNECCSISTDGRLLWWDTRKLSEGPTDEMVLDYNKSEDQKHTFGGTCMEYRSDAGATKYLIGTEQGETVFVDRKASKDKGSQKSIKTVYGETVGRHHGPVYSLQRNPFNLKYFMTVGDWTARIWMEDLKAPVLTTCYSSSYLTAGCWSPSRPGVFFCTKKDGTLDVWDYYYKQKDPIFTTKVGDVGLSSISLQANGKLVALGAEDGTTTVLELSRALSDMQPDEKNVIANMFERENKRERNLEMRLVQKRREEKEAERAAANENKTEFDPEAAWDPQIQTTIDEAQEAFYESLKKFQAQDEMTSETAGDAEEDAE
jgi:dynein intermediate chain 2